jgi:RNA polymerase sigma-70 factor (ECF subfamily)
MTPEQLYRDYYGLVYGFLLSLSGDRHLSEELAGETFHRAIRHFSRYDGSCKLSTWLCTIARNLFVSEHRRRKRQVSLEEALSLQLPSVEEAVIDRDTAERILALARQLPEEKRQVFLLRVWGHSFREIGEALGKSETWARVTFFRVKQEILERLEGSK